MQYLVTGSSGFIGFHTTKKLLEMGHSVVGFDNENDYYDMGLKRQRRKILEEHPNFSFIKGDISQKSDIENCFNDIYIDRICHLAAQAGVRYSLENPDVYIQSNIVGFFNLLECAKSHRISHIVYASSSSVYGHTSKAIFSITNKTDSPLSLYATTKKTNELFAYTYAQLFGISLVGLRFFTVYGPRGRPDMAYFTFLDKLYHNQPIQLFGNGEIQRDFTYIDDIVEGIIKALEYENPTKYSLFNLGNHSPVSVNQLVTIIEKITGKKFIKEYLPMQAGEVEYTYADISETERKLGRNPKIPLEEGLKKFVDWYNGSF